MQEMDVRDSGLDLSHLPWSGRFPGVGNGSPVQYSCLENPMDQGGGLQSVGWQRLRHAQTQAQKVKNCMSKHMAGKCQSNFFLQFSVVQASLHLKEKWPQECPWAGGRSHTRRTSRLCSHSRGSWIPALSLGCYCFLLSAHFLYLDTHLFWKEILIPRSHESDMVVMFTVIRTVF